MAKSFDGTLGDRIVRDVPDSQIILICWHPADRGHWVCDCGETFHSNAMAIIHKIDHAHHHIFWQCAVCGEVLTAGAHAASPLTTADANQPRGYTPAALVG